MKKSILFIFFFFIYSRGILLASDTSIILNPLPPSNPPYPRSLVQYRHSKATATLNDTEVVLNFNATVGSAVITVTDTNGFLVYQQIINTDTNSSSELYIPIDTWDRGNYILTIEYSSEIVIGNFTI